MGITLKNNGLSLADALFSESRKRLFGFLFGQPDRQFQSAELIRLVGTGTGAVLRQLSRLVAVGIVDVKQIGNQKHYSANKQSPLFGDLHGLVIKTVGLAEPLRQALAPLSARIHSAFVYGSVASGRDRASSDIDLLIVSDTLTYFDVYVAVAKAETTLGRTINPTVISSGDWRARLANPDSFVGRIANGPRVLIIGTDAGQD